MTVRSRTWRVRRPWPRATVIVAAVVLALGLGGGPAVAIPTDPANNPCMSGSSASLTLTASSIKLGESVGLDWGLQRPNGCPMIPSLYFRDVLGVDHPVDIHATAVTPPATGTYLLRVLSNAFTYDVGSASITVVLPTVNGHPMAAVTGGGGDQAALFAQGAGTAGAVVAVRGDVDLDLSDEGSVPVAGGVQIIGERDAAHPAGPRLFTTSLPRPLLEVSGDNVRITGIRFDGMESSDPCDEAGLADDSDAIGVRSWQHIEIDHDEFYHWTGSGVAVRDPAGRIGRDNRDTVLVHDDYLHDNQHPTYCGLNPFGSGHGGGYGVSVGQGAYVTVQHDVFSDNRHAIEANGEDGDGYYALGNLFLRPGIDDEKDFITNYNHFIDVHGQGTCGNGEHFNCGTAGEYFQVVDNTVVSMLPDPGAAAGIQLRGTPSSATPVAAFGGGGMWVSGNVFAQARDTALTQTESGLVDAGDNQYSAPVADFYSRSGLPQCDFDGDGRPDAFRPSAATWWYYSSRWGHWLDLPGARPGTTVLGDVNGDGLCDVTAGGVTVATPPVFESFPVLTTAVPFTYGKTQAAATAAIVSAGLAVGIVRQIPSTAPKGNVVAQSPLTGAARVGTAVALTVSSGGTAVPNVVGRDRAGAIATVVAAGLTAGTVTGVVNAAAPGTVIAQSVVAGSVVLQGTAVDLTVSLGAVTVPNVLSWDQAQAQSRIAGAGLAVGSVSTTNNCIAPGTVQVQHPSPGTVVAASSAVDLTISTCSNPTGGGGDNPPKHEQ